METHRQTVCLHTINQSMINNNASVGIQASPRFRSHQPALHALYLFHHSLLLLRLTVALIDVEYNCLNRDYSSVTLSIYSGKNRKSS